MPLNPLQRAADPYMLVVGVTGVKLGEQVAQLGCAHGGRLAAVAKRVGLSGRAVAFVPDEASAARARRGAADAGVLLEVEPAGPTHLPADSAAFDLVIVDDTGGFVTSMSDSDRSSTLREAWRVLRPAGRLIVIGAAGVTGLSRLWKRGGASTDPASTLDAQGFKSIRRLAERDGLFFVEGIKPRDH